MKKLVMIMMLSVSMTSFADVIKEYDQGEEMACHTQAKSLGCVKSDGTENKTCLKKQLSRLSKSCQQIHKDKGLK